MASERSQPLRGTVRVPGDKSISHRALMLGALSSGCTRIKGLLEAEDVLNTARAVAALGAPTKKTDDNTWQVLGRGIGGLSEPSGPLDFGNSGTGTRLMMGVIAGHPMTATLTGDASLTRRPMGRVLTPLKQMGLQVLDGNHDTLPLTIRGSSALVPISYQLPVASAQLKSAILLAGLAAAGETTVISEQTRDHTERMMRFFGARVRSERHGAMVAVTVEGEAELTGGDVTVPGDPSSAAFLIAAALIVPGSEVTVEGVLVNQTRFGFYDTLREMGADLVISNLRDEGGEPVADLTARHGPLKGAVVPPERAPSMIDEYPMLAVVAAFARERTRMQGLGELRVKESDRLAATAAGLAANGVDVTVEGDTLIVDGRQGGAVPGGGQVATHMDHRIAMAFLTMGLASERPVAIDDGSFIATSFSEYEPLMVRLGAQLTSGQ